MDRTPYSMDLNVRWELLIIRARYRWGKLRRKLPTVCLVLPGAWVVRQGGRTGFGRRFRRVSCGVFWAKCSL